MTREEWLAKIDEGPNVGVETTGVAALDSVIGNLNLVSAVTYLLATVIWMVVKKS